MSFSAGSEKNPSDESRQISDRINILLELMLRGAKPKDILNFLALHFYEVPLAGDAVDGFKNPLSTPLLDPDHR
jgi:hypothetical protein